MSDSHTTAAGDGIIRISEPYAVVEISSPMAFVKVTGPACVVDVTGTPTATQDWDRLLRASVPERWKSTTHPVGAVQSYIAELELALKGLLEHSYVEECQECGIGRSAAWGRAKEAIGL